MQTNFKFFLGLKFKYRLKILSLQILTNPVLFKFAGCNCLHRINYEVELVERFYGNLKSKEVIFAVWLIN